MGVYEGRGQLSKGIKDLMQRWADTKATWDDAVSRDFEKVRLHQLEGDLKNAFGAMDHMATLLSQVRKDCE